MSKNPPAPTLGLEQKPDSTTTLGLEQKPDSTKSWRLAGLVPEEANEKPSPLESIPEKANEKPSTAPSPAQDIRGLVGQGPSTVIGMRNLLEMNSAKGENSQGSQK
jgi:hypothetical protein